MYRTMLTDKRGGVISYVANRRGHRQQADLAKMAPGRTGDDAARALALECPGWYLSTLDPQLAAALRASGAAPTRHDMFM